MRLLDINIVFMCVRVYDFLYAPLDVNMSTCENSYFYCVTGIYFQK